MKTLERPDFNQCVPQRYEFNVSQMQPSMGGRSAHVFVAHRNGPNSFHDAEELFALLQTKFPEDEGYRIDVSAIYEYGQFLAKKEASNAR